MVKIRIHLDEYEEDPALYRIMAKIMAGKACRISVRYDQDDQRLKDPVDCLGVLKNVRRKESGSL